MGTIVSLQPPQTDWARSASTSEPTSPINAILRIANAVENRKDTEVIAVYYDTTDTAIQWANLLRHDDDTATDVYIWRQLTSGAEQLTRPANLEVLGSDQTGLTQTQFETVMGVPAGGVVNTLLNSLNTNGGIRSTDEIAAIAASAVTVKTAVETEVQANVAKLVELLTAVGTTNTTLANVLLALQPKTVTIVPTAAAATWTEVARIDTSGYAHGSITFTVATGALTGLRLTGMVGTQAHWIRQSDNVEDLINEDSNFVTYQSGGSDWTTLTVDAHALGLNLAFSELVVDAQSSASGTVATTCYLSNTRMG